MTPDQVAPTPDQSAVTPQSLPTTPQIPVDPPNDPPADPPSKSDIYPAINIKRNEKPNRFYAFPLIGFIAKIIILIPVFIWVALVGIVSGSLTTINSFIVLFTGKYWKPAYDYNLNYLRLSIKVSYFMSGLTDKYPGFSFTIQDDFTVDLTYPEKSNKIFAIPILGGIFRIILLIPYFIYQSVIGSAGNIGVFVSFFPVLFMGKYPESTYELARDSVRVSQAVFVYTTGISDKYPSFYISMNHKTIKIILIVLGILFSLGQFGSRMLPTPKTNPPVQYTSPNTIPNVNPIQY